MGPAFIEKLSVGKLHGIGPVIGQGARLSCTAHYLTLVIRKCAQVSLHHPGISRQFLRRSRDCDATGLEHMRLVADLEAEPSHLLNNQDREAARPEFTEGVEYRAHDDWRKPERWLVQKQHLRPADKRPPDRHHLLLAAGQ